jgi:A/G-specific adenine glycosylase
MSEVMLQQTTVAAVTGYFAKFTALWPTVADLAAAEDSDVMAQWAGLGYYARARNLLACARAVVRDHGGVFPADEATLRSLPGIGPYTAAAISAIAFGRRAVVVDGNVERVMARLFAIQTPLPAAKPQLVARAATVTPDQRAGDYAQAVMDLGRLICTPRNPSCAVCPLMDICAGRAIAGELPRKLAKPEKPTRTGTAWIVQAGDLHLIERRAERGLLGGMLAFPSTGWDGSDTPPPLDADWRELGTVRHTFTHFHLHLQVLFSAQKGNPNRGTFAQIHAPDLPTLMRKAFALVPR